MRRWSQRIRTRARSVSPIVLVVALLVIVGSTTTAVAISVTSTGPEKISIFSSQTTDSDFALSYLDADAHGRNTVTVAMELQNTAETAQSANLTVQLLDTSGTVIVEQQVQTGSVSAGATYSTHLTFTQQGLAADYEETLVIVNQK